MSQRPKNQVPITLQTFLDVSGVIFLALDKQGTITLINQKGCDILEYTQKQLLGMNWFDHFITKETVNDVKSVFRRILDGKMKTAEYYENTILTKSGQEKIIFWHNAILRDEKGNVTGTLSSGEDITAKKHIEKALQYRAELERLITTTSTHMVNLSSKMIDKGITQALKKIGKFADVDRSYVFIFQNNGQKMDNTHEWCAKGIQSKIIQLKNIPMNQFQWSLGKIMQSEIVHIPRVSDLPPEATAEKNEFESKKIKSLVIVPMIHSKHVMGFLGFDSVRTEKSWSEDIIMLLKAVGEIFANALERKQAEEALRISEEKFSQAFHSNPNVMAIHTLEEGRFIDVNECFEKNIGYSREEVIGHTSTELNLFVNPKDRIRWLQKLKKVGGFHDMETHIRTKTGEVRIGEFSAEIIAIEGTQCLLTVMNDITERKQMEEALRKSEHRLNTAQERAKMGCWELNLETGEIFWSQEMYHLHHMNQSLKPPTFKQYLRFVHPDDRHLIHLIGVKQISVDYEKAIKKKKSATVDYRTNPANGPVRWFNITVEVEYRSDQTHIMRGTLTDITERKQTEEALRISEERFSKAFHANPIIMGISTMKEGRFIDVNESFLEASGYKRKDIIGHTSAEINIFVNPNERKEFIQMMKSGEKIRDVEVRTRNKSGEIRLGAFSIEPVEMGGVPCLLTVTKDITDRKRAEEALRIQHELGVTLSSVDNLTEALNEILKAALQVEEIDSASLYLFDENTGALDLIVHQGYSDHFVRNLSHYPADASYTKLILEGKPIYSHSSELPSRFIKPILLEGLRALATIPLTYEGKIIGSLNLTSHSQDAISDINRHALESIATQIGGVITRLKAEEALQKSEERYRIVSEMISDIAFSVLVKSDKSMVQEWVAGALTAITGYSETELAAHGGHIISLIHPDDTAIAQKHLHMNLSDRPDMAEYRILDKDGRIHWLRDYGYPLWDKEQNRVVRIIGAAQDITKRKKAEEQIQKDLKEKEILLKEIYHRVKNNLNVITSLLNLQARKIQTKEEALEGFRESRDRVFAMAMIHEKLYMSKDFSRVDMKSYVKSVIRELSHVYKMGKAITLDINIEDVYLDMNTAIPCGLILNELVTNIFKYAFPDKRKGRLQIEFHQNKKGQYELTIHDNGVGLPQDMDIDHLDSLGLQLVRMLTKQIDGVLKIDRNEGTRFQITFPVKTL